MVTSLMCHWGCVVSFWQLSFGVNRWCWLWLGRDEGDTCILHMACVLQAQLVSFFSGCNMFNLIIWKPVSKWEARLWFETVGPTHFCSTECAEWLNGKVHAYKSIVVPNNNLHVKFYSPCAEVAQSFEDINRFSRIVHVWNICPNLDKTGLKSNCAYILLQIQWTMTSVYVDRSKQWISQCTCAVKKR